MMIAGGKEAEVLLCSLCYKLEQEGREKVYKLF